jgi:hypothetical protein
MADEIRGGRRQKPLYPQIDNVTFREQEAEERLKITLPIERDWQNWLFLVLLTASLIVWVAMIIIILSFLFRDVLPNRERYTFVLTVMLLVWLLLWYYLGRTVWNRWQYHAANREILFINDAVLIVRRPVSILGVTDAYDMQHVNPFYYSEEHECPAFTYGSQRIYFGQHLAEKEARALISVLNRRFFPYHDEDGDLL